MGLRYSKSADANFNFENKLDVEMIFKFNAYAEHLIEEDLVDDMVMALTKGFNYWNPKYRKHHPCYRMLDQLAKTLVEKHYYHVKVHDPQHGYGVQVCVYTPDGKSFYHSNYDYEQHEHGPISKAVHWLQKGMSIGDCFNQIANVIIRRAQGR